MIAKSLKHTINIRKGDTVCFNTFKGTDIIHYHIPDSYVELQYIYSPSNKKCYIDTGIVPPNNSTIKVKMSCSAWSTSDTASGYVCGTIDTHVALRWDSNSISTGWGLSKTTGVQNGSFKATGNTSTHLMINSCYSIDGELYTTTQSDWIQHMNYQVWTANNICILNLIPVRRLGDGVCGMFDTISQTFKQSSTQYQFKGGDAQWILKHNINVRSSDNTVHIGKSDTECILKKSFISSGTYANTIDTYYICKYDNDTYSKWASSSVITPYHIDTNNHGDFSRVYINCKATVPIYYMQNVNPNWNIYKGQLVTDANQYESNNQNLYYANQDTVHVYSIITKQDIQISTSSISRIVHIPYLEYTGTESYCIDINHMENINDYTVDLLISNMQANNSGILGVATANTTRGLAVSLDTSGSTLLIGNRSISLQDTDYTQPIRFSAKECIYKYNHNRAINTNTASLATTHSCLIGGVGIATNPIDEEAAFDGDNKIASGTRVHYIRFETHNQLYKHLIPAILILNNYTFEDSNGDSQSYIIGYFEAVNQVFYQADANTLPAYTGDSLASDFSNVLDINGDIITDFPAV